MAGGATSLQATHRESYSLNQLNHNNTVEFRAYSSRRFEMIEDMTNPAFERMKRTDACYRVVSTSPRFRHCRPPDRPSARAAVRGAREAGTAAHPVLTPPERSE